MMGLRHLRMARLAERKRSVQNHVKVVHVFTSSRLSPDPRRPVQQKSDAPLPERQVCCHTQYQTELPRKKMIRTIQFSKF
jgi:hypothetical protein